ncbi:MAG: hypothetical protein ACLR0U_06345 [Enterocloster clostridioformis]
MFVVPIIVLVVLMVMSYSPQKALFIAVFTLIAMGLAIELMDKSNRSQWTPLRNLSQKFCLDLNRVRRPLQVLQYVWQRWDA